MKIVKKIHSGFKQTPIGNIPIDWELAVLGKYINCFSGGTPLRSQPKYYNGIIPWIKSGELNGKVITKTEELITDDAVKKSSTKFVEPNTLLYALYGATAGIPAFNVIQATINQAILAIIPKKSALNNVFLYFWFLYKRDKLISIYTQGAQPNLSSQIVKNYKIPLPPLPEQKKITEILSTWDSAIETITKLIDAKMKLKKGLMQQLLTGRTRFKEFGEPVEKDELPEAWKERAIGEIFVEEKRSADLKDDYQYNLVTVKRRNGGVEKRSNLKGREILTKNQFFIKTDDFLISKRQIVHGACGVVPKELSDSIVSNEYLVLRVRNGYNIIYLKYFSCLPVFKKDCYLSSIGVHIEKMLFKPQWWFKTKYYFPTLSEQNHIASVLITADKAIKILNKKLEALKQQKKGLMQQLLTGKTRVKV